MGIFPIFGRDAGFTALYAAYVTSIRCCIPEAPFDAEQLAHLVMEDKNNNPSGYAMLLMSEGASWAGHAIEEYGPPDAFGHRKKISVASQFSAEFTRITGEETTVADLTYDLRSGEPDFLDKMVANSFATMAFDCVASGAKRRMMAIKRGCYADVDIPDPTLGPRTVDVATMYDTDRFRPNYASKNGLPIFMLSA